MAFIHDDFLLDSPQACRLYHDYAKSQPIVDYHCHLPPQDVAANRRFSNLHEIWLEGDHYKWRAMRAAGFSEDYCTGDVEPYDKFLAFATAVPQTLRNPLYHWSHLELKRYFGIDTLLNPETAPEIWQETEAQLRDDRLSAHGILKAFNVELVGTTDDPAAPLPHHEAIAKSGLSTRVVPTYRPDLAFTFTSLNEWKGWLGKLAQTSGLAVDSAKTLLAALRKRHDDFGALGCRLSDHGLEAAYYAPCTAVQAEAIFAKAYAGTPLSEGEIEQFATYILRHVGQWNAEKGWAMQLHIGAIRNTRSRLFTSLGRDIGCDSVGDAPQAQKLAAFLDSLDADGTLPKTILYNLNPADNYVFATMIGNFQDGSCAGKIQWGSGWWFLDQLEGMQWQLNALSSQGLLSRFIGMLTDSRSFMSYPRHEYFRRLLCNLLGEDMRRGLIPDDIPMVGAMVSDICYHNVNAYLKA